MACPLVSLLAALNNLVAIRAQSYRLCQSYQRPSLELLPAFGGRGVPGIGSWSTVLYLMVYASVATNCALVFFAIKSVQEWFPELLVRVLLFFVAEHGILALGRVLESLVPPTAQHILDDRAREQHQKTMKKQDERLGMHTLDPSRVELCQEPWRLSGSDARRQSHV
jgi:hypothetical protein